MSALSRRNVFALLFWLGSSLLAQAQNPIAISPVLPSDVLGGASTAPLSTAAIFAWQEFIALNWPALQGQRDIPDVHQKFGASTPALTWETYRSKVEIFNLTPNKTPPGYSATPPSYGYNAVPAYYYSSSLVPACPGQQKPRRPAWINLDETTQIGLDQIFAGGPAIKSNKNTAPQLIRFAVKANHVEYEYVAKNQYFNPTIAKVPARNGMNAYTAQPPKSPKSPFISFPAGTVEIKSAWRPLNANDDPSHFHIRTARFYEKKGPNKTRCYFEAPFALVALHIIQKTPSAPSFIYATFEQADNIRQPNGTPVEDANGKVIHPIPGVAPTTPAMTYKDSATNPKVSVSGGACKPQDNLYFKDNSTDLGLTGGIPICVNRRYEAIPPEVIRVNQIAHQAIASYDSRQHVQKSPWPYYKLVSVQTTPFDLSTNPPPKPARGPSVFYQANITVETDYTLQQFKGRIADNGAPTSVPAKGVPPPPNVVAPPTGAVKGYNMGGCMGCHGNAEVSGFDFSFILAGGFTAFPDTPSRLSGSSAAAVSAKYLKLFLH